MTIMKRPSYAAVERFRKAVIATTGYAPDVIEAGKRHRYPTSQRRGDDAGWCYLFEDLRAGVFGCFRQGVFSTWTDMPAERMTSAERARLLQQVQAAKAQRQAEQRARWDKNAANIRALLSESHGVSVGDPVALYLKRRRVDDAGIPASLRFHPALRYWHEDGRVTTHPGMVAPLTDADGNVVALHRTFLTADGRKADVPTVKKLTPASGPLAGACVRLFEPVGSVLGVAEGIETALGAACASRLPVAAAYSAGNLAAWQWPTGVKHVVVFGDQDEAGRCAADRLVSRVRAAGLTAALMIPTEPGTDWCDVWASRGAVEVRT